MIPEEKYNVSVPRYTSYPPANYFEPMDNSRYMEAIERSNSNGSRKISFYLHMPFCRRLCHYCGCNSYIMPHDSHVVTKYIDALHKEIDLVASHLDCSRPISQIHYGGGSPTAMPVSVLKELNEHMLSLFPCIDNPEIAIECHPGYLTRNDWEELTMSHFTRFSIGVQDLDAKVLHAVGRAPSALPIREITDLLHAMGATVSMDFLFGLPYQTPEEFVANLLQGAEARPERIVTFSYGHVPWVFKRQQVLEKYGLPEAETKQRMYDAAAVVLQELGYCQLGLDHFVLPDDELYQALKSGLLHRNFQGYCTRRTTGQVYALGVTGISQLDTFYAQNTKDISEYIKNIEEGKLTTIRGYQLTARERIVKEVIEQLMCNYRIDWCQMASVLDIDIPTLKSVLHYDEHQLREMADDGLMTISEEGLAVTSEGHPYVRNVAAALDPLMVNTDKKFSKPV